MSVLRSLRGLLLGLIVASGFLAGVPALAAAPATAQASDYQLGVGDILHIVVFQNPDLTLDARVSDSGLITFPLLGEVKVGGMTVTQAERAIEAGLKKGQFVNNPQVTIVLTQVRGNQVSVLGQFNRPGRYPLEQARTRLSDVIALAGGVVTPLGSDTVTVLATRQGKPVRFEIDLPQLFAAHDPQADILLENNDVVWVDRAPVVYIYGEVQRPGPMRLERHMTVMQALASGGGLTPRGTERGIRIHRRNPESGKTDVVQPAMDDEIRDGDVIYVRESLF